MRETLILLFCFIYELRLFVMMNSNAMFFFSPLPNKPVRKLHQYKRINGVGGQVIDIIIVILIMWIIQIHST